MMMNERLIGMVPESRKYVAACVAIQWGNPLVNIAAMTAVARTLAALYAQTLTAQDAGLTALVLAFALLARFLCVKGSSRMSFLASKTVKKTLRNRIYEKLLALGASYDSRVQTSEIVQVAVEGVDQLETYFGAYLPQFFYAMLAPLTLFAALAPISLRAAAALLVCVPLIPVAIALVQTWAKKLLSRYWGKYTALGDTFLENLQGLTTLKIYRADEQRHREMNEAAEDFRKITMKVLTMQLNSITIMDIIAYGGAALGMALAVSQLAAGSVSLAGALTIMLLSADFFLPMRQLGSFFHIAMNGMAASDKIFKLLDLETPKDGGKPVSGVGVRLSDVRFSYDGEREILHGVSISCAEKGLTALVGESGSGKSTVAALLTGRAQGYTGSVMLGGTEICDLSEAALAKAVTYVGFAAYLFKGTVRDNLLMGNPNATDAQLWDALEKTQLADFVHSQGGLDMRVAERGGNLSGGQWQRLAFARALLADSPMMIFDEATSGVDVESENAIMAQIEELAKTKAVLVIAHRLMNVVHADCIHVMASGNVVESGTHEQLMARGGTYAKLFETQKALEDEAKGAGE